MTARVKIDDILEHLDTELSRALEDAVRANLPGAEFDGRMLYKDFVKCAYRRCGTWEMVPDRCVEIG